MNKVEIAGQTFEDTDIWALSINAAVQLGKQVYKEPGQLEEIKNEFILIFPEDKFVQANQIFNLVLNDGKAPTFTFIKRPFAGKVILYLALFSLATLGVAHFVATYFSPNLSLSGSLVVYGTAFVVLVPFQFWCLFKFMKFDKLSESTGATS